MNRQILALVTLALVGTVSAVGITGSSSATWVSASANSASVTAAADWTPPTVKVTQPSSPARGTITVTATASDAESGVASVELRVRGTGDTQWRTLCAATTTPYACSWNTIVETNGSYELSARATDNAGYAATSAPVGVLVDNTSGSITLADPGNWLEGTVTLTATASSTVPITTVRFQRTPTGGNAWTDLCTDTAAPWTCAWNTRTAADGVHDLRAVLTDADGNQTLSNVIGSRTVDNVTTPLRGVDVQTTNGGNAGRVDIGDTLVFTYSRLVDPATVTPGWGGGDLPVRLEIGNSSPLVDELLVTRPGSTVNLGSTKIGATLIPLGQSHAFFDATLKASTEIVAGRARTIVTVRIGRLVSGGVRTVNLASDLTWQPSNQVKTLGGLACATTTVTESGATDKDF